MTPKEWSDKTVRDIAERKAQRKRDIEAYESNKRTRMSISQKTMKSFKVVK